MHIAIGDPLSPIPPQVFGRFFQINISMISSVNVNNYEGVLYNI